MDYSQNALRVLEKRYLMKDEKGNVVETVEEMFRRVARHVAQADRQYDENADVSKLEAQFYEMMAGLEFLPNSPTLMNAGKELGQLSACFVLPVEDSIEGIFDAIKNAAIIHKSGGGTGFSFSRLRPNGAAVASTGGIASGPVSFMRVFNAATEAVKQGGTRRGANMGILRVDHPDILEFIQCKKKNTEINNFNISVGITEKFMHAVEMNQGYELIDPHSGRVVKKLDARNVFQLIVDMAWRNGEPGIVFLDRLNRDNPTPLLGEIESTNPCGEQPLLPYESCNLGSINLSKMIRQDHLRKSIDYKRLEEIVFLAVHFLDNVIDVNRYPLKEIEEMTLKTRKIGLGVMGFADMLIQLGIPYDSEEGVQIAQDVMCFIDQKSKEMSEKLAEKRGVFPAYEDSIYKERNRKLRNATTTTIAPTGTISIIAGASSGVEPLFAISYFRNVMDKEKLLEIHPLFEQTAKERGFYSKELMEDVAQTGSIQQFVEIPEDVKRIFVTAHDISPYWHVRMQAAFQQYVDNAVSKTVNFRNEASKKEVEEVFKLAYQQGCKGITIYRDGSREEQVLNIGTLEREKYDSTYNHCLIPRPRPAITTGLTEKVKIGCGNLYITANYDEQGICEVITNLGRAGGCPSQSEATSRIISIALRSGVQVEAIIEQLKGIRCHSTLNQRAKGNKEIKVLSCPDAIARTLERLVNRGENGREYNVMDIALQLEAEAEEYDRVQKNAPEADEMAMDRMDFIQPGVRKQIEEGKICEECGMPMHHENGCVVCKNCGFSKCG